MSDTGDPTPKPAELNTRRGVTFPIAASFWDGDLKRACAQYARREHDQHVIQMNEVYRCASGEVQRAEVRVARMIDEPGHPTGHLVIPF